MDGKLRLGTLLYQILLISTIIEMLIILAREVPIRKKEGKVPFILSSSDFFLLELARGL